MPRRIRRLLAPSLLIAFASTPVQAQTPAGRDALPPQQNLSEFEGLYHYRDGGSLVMVADGERLVAIIAEAKYPLRAVATDTFANPGGDLIPFLRDTAGHIVAFQEHGDTFARLSTVVGAETRQLLVPRSPGPDGRPLPYRCTAPPALSDGIRVGEMRPGTLSCAVAEQVVNGVLDGTYPDVRAVAVHHGGALVLEEYFYGFERDRPHQMRSLTKSVISLLAGAAVDRGLLGADEPVLSRLGYTSIANPDPRKDRITLTDLLSNQPGLACDDHDGASPGNEVKLYDAADWPRAFVDLPVLAEPGTTGRYCSFGFITAGRIIELAAGKPLAEFAQEVLFDPLDISPAQSRWTFVLDRSQRNEFGQIYLRPRDMLKLGLLIHQRGVWQGRRVISESWIDAAVARQSRVDDSDYGLGIWHRWYGVTTPSGTQRVETIMLSGNGGQKVYIVPSLELVVVFTGGAFNVESPTNTIMAGVLLPALLEAGPAPAPPARR
jgi:CubicO group peptidase (beta-lactamase class C family)